MKAYVHILSFTTFCALLLGSCGTKKQMVSTTIIDVVQQPSEPVSDTVDTDYPRPYYYPHLKYRRLELYTFSPKPQPLSDDDRYELAFQDIKDMLDGKTDPSFERAVFLSENPYYDGLFTYSAFQNSITKQLMAVKKIIATHNNSDQMNFDASVNQYGRFKLADIRYLPKEKKELYQKALSNWAIFKYLTDTIFENTYSITNHTVSSSYHVPYSYATSDPFGMKDWSNSQVINLLVSNEGKGNCFALTALYKILSDRLNADARICTAPQHIYIQHRDPKGHYYNVELATAGHPGDGIIQTLTYTPTDAIMSGIALRDYDAKQSIGLCLINLAKSYEHKFNTKDAEFMLRCAELALKCDSLNLNALLLKAQVLDARVAKYASKGHINNINQLKQDIDISATLLQLEKHLALLQSLGYRQMPLDMQQMIMNPLHYDPKTWDHKSRNPRPFTSFEPKDPKDAEYWTLTKGMFQEVFEPTKKETYGHFTISTSTKKIIAMDTANMKGFLIDPVAFAYDFGARIYDARIGHFVSVDPLQKMYPSLSPYSFVDNNPIRLIDADGRVITIPDGKGGSIIYTPGMKADGYSAATAKHISYLNNLNANSEYMKTQLNTLSSSQVEYNIAIGTAKEVNLDKGGATTYNFNNNRIEISIVEDGELTNAFLGDEIRTGVQFENNEIGYAQFSDGGVTVTGYDLRDEVDSKVGAVEALKTTGKTAQQLDPNNNYESTSLMTLIENGNASDQNVEKWLQGTEKYKSFFGADAKMSTNTSGKAGNSALKKDYGSDVKKTIYRSNGKTNTN